ncbi:response regulator [Massilia dura]|uniref:Response regulator n=1 Tax=Pseudoduganella dura TaxID=321982 RepID=A0A6I3XUE0_9BURK|nr:response regulator transcription factor [Pseudoduganella dura]MUI16108.1 response regulator [Pseudoduganella dura]GGY11770.1 DNA-binding response regulator [Pseudoduganella dura]
MKPLVYIVDDDAALRDGLSSLLRSADMDVATFGAVADFLGHRREERNSCLLLDVRLGGQSGMDLHAELKTQGCTLPVVFMTGFGDIPMSVRAMKAGAVDFLAKPVRVEELLDAVGQALARDAACRADEALQAGLRHRYGTLTPREREIMALAARGLMNKQIAGEVGTSEITVKIHRGQAMKKMGAKTFADLVRMAEALRIGAD